MCGPFIITWYFYIVVFRLTATILNAPLASRLAATILNAAQFLLTYQLQLTEIEGKVRFVLSQRQLFR